MCTRFDSDSRCSSCQSHYNGMQGRTHSKLSWAMRKAQPNCGTQPGTCCQHHHIQASTAAHSLGTGSWPLLPAARPLALLQASPQQPHWHHEDVQQLQQLWPSKQTFTLLELFQVHSVLCSVQLRWRTYSLSHKPHPPSPMCIGGARGLGRSRSSRVESRS
jgi:hypothetical protein